MYSPYRLDSCFSVLFPAIDTPLPHGIIPNHDSIDEIDTLSLSVACRLLSSHSNCISILLDCLFLTSFLTGAVHNCQREICVIDAKNARIRPAVGLFLAIIFLRINEKWRSDPAGLVTAQCTRPALYGDEIDGCPIFFRIILKMILKRDTSESA